VKSARPATIGAEIDGSTLRVVRVEDNVVVHYEKFSHLSSAASVAAIRHLSTSSGHVQVVISWASPGTAMQRVSAHELVVPKTDEMIREVINRHIPAGSGLPGAGLVQSDGNVSPPSAMVGVITSELARDLLREISDPNFSLMAAPFTLTRDGLYLAIRESCVELTLVRDSIPVSTRQLTGGGLSSLTALDGVPLEYDALSPENSEALRRWTANISREVQRTIGLWERNGDVCPRTLLISGSGAALPQLPTYLKNVGLVVTPAPFDNNIDIGIIPQDEFPSAFGALVAATLPTVRLPFIDMSRRTKSALRKRPRSLSPWMKNSTEVLTTDGGRRLSGRLSGMSDETSLPRGTGVAILSGVAVVLLVGFSWIWSGRRIENAQRAVVVANRELQSSQDAKAKQNAVPELDKFASFVQPDWTTAITSLFESLPPEPRVASVAFVKNGGSIEARFVVAVPLEKIREWEIALAGSGAAVSIVQSDDSAEGKKEYTLRFFEDFATSIGGGT
jgi:hypothetical protein